MEQRDLTAPVAPHGVWAAVATPFDERERFDEGVLRENVRRLAAAGVHGIYSTDADGEFYALELDDFARVVDALADETARAGVACQVGVSWSSTAGVTRRLAHCVSRGVQGAHVGHPIYMQMTTESWLRYWDDVAAAVPDSFALIHYNTPKMPNHLTGPQYAQLAARIPQLTGTKYVGSDVVEFAALVRHAPRLAHFCGEQAFGFLAPYGATGLYSWFVNFNPRFMLAWYEDARCERWAEVVRKQRRMLELIEASAILVEGGNEHAVIAKALCSASDFLIDRPTVRRPYLPVPPERVRAWQRLVDERFPDLVWTP
ncbi:dihydrodipicolinate synthase family protein [Conexibacter sp. CPCC 206217]|uniref:dihydrodipicolinate synthase family protein n=1 Tax=Conexibacter sp. CPCC 206217 TaxID=3064574 RepID=UPI002722880E|nr:dihydrodipicolinate synthase family protein [Conexibacter sp. CPCC 206217]MDO8210333.1 dihydrodipicolinate synthase family protein [Conexibacter sp. CPCC 206217]